MAQDAPGCTTLNTPVRPDPALRPAPCDGTQESEHALRSQCVTYDGKVRGTKRMGDEHIAGQTLLKQLALQEKAFGPARPWGRAGIKWLPISLGAGAGQESQTPQPSDSAALRRNDAANTRGM